MDGRAFGEREEVVRHGGRKRRIDGNHNRGGSWGEVYFFSSKSRGFRAPTVPYPPKPIPALKPFASRDWKNIYIEKVLLRLPRKEKKTLRGNLTREAG